MTIFATKRDVKFFFLSVMHTCIAVSDFKARWVDFSSTYTIPFCEICQLDIKYTDKKKSGSEILYFHVYVSFYVFMCVFIFVFERIIKSDAFPFRLTVLRVSMTFKITISENVLKIREKLTFDFVAFLFSLSVYLLKSKTKFKSLEQLMLE